MRIVEDDLSGAKVAELLSGHLAGMARHSPPHCFGTSLMSPAGVHAGD